MSPSDRALGILLAGAAAILALPLALTLFPGAIQQSLHASESVMRIASLFVIVPAVRLAAMRY